MEGFKLGKLKAGNIKNLFNKVVNKIKGGVENDVSNKIKSKIELSNKSNESIILSTPMPTTPIPTTPMPTTPMPTTEFPSSTPTSSSVTLPIIENIPTLEILSNVSSLNEIYQGYQCEDRINQNSSIFDFSKRRKHHKNKNYNNKNYNNKKSNDYNSIPLCPMFMNYNDESIIKMENNMINDK